MLFSGVYENVEVARYVTKGSQEQCDLPAVMHGVNGRMLHEIFERNGLFRATGNRELDSLRQSLILGCIRLTPKFRCKHTTEERLLCPSRRRRCRLACRRPLVVTLEHWTAMQRIVPLALFLIGKGSAHGSDFIFVH